KRGDAIVAGYYAVAQDLGCGGIAAPTRTTMFLGRLAGADGTCAWSKAYGGSAPGGLGSNVRVLDAALDPTGAVVVAGVFGDVSGTGVDENFGGTTLTIQGVNDMFLATYEPTLGGHLRSLRLGSDNADPATSEHPDRIAIDATGDVVVIGGFDTSGFAIGTASVVNQSVSPGRADVFFAKLASDGSARWLRGFGGRADEVSGGIAVSSGGQVTVVGNDPNDHLGVNACTFDGAVFGGDTDAYVITLGP
ncbi:MAG: hypothetical protein NT062_13805, partial [Proteobacteria bacterium]|nr:hypothetical protein [Pseudomonadota bacterium]